MNKIQNPVLSGFHADPSICFANGKYYIATSTFEWFPGVMIYESSDMVNFELVSQPLNNLKLLDMTGNLASCGVWAPCLTFDNGKFYLVYSNVRTWTDLPFKDVDNFITTATEIDGEWSEPVYINSSGFDPSLFHDDDGKKYFVNMEWNHEAGTNEGSFSGILIQEYDEKKGELVGEIHKIFKGTIRGFVEGPHIYKRNGYYYLFSAEGGTSISHAESVARSKNIFGPYELHPNALLITSFNTTATLQKAGHASMCCDNDGNYYLAHLCGRPLENYNCILGRETAIQNIYWENDWCYIKSNEDYDVTAPRDFYEVPNNAVKVVNNETSYDFTNKKQMLDFQSLRVPLSIGNRCRLEDTSLVLKGGESLYSNHYQSLLARRQKFFNSEVVTCMEFAPTSFQHMAGLSYRYNEKNQYFLYITYDEEIKQKVLNLYAIKFGDSMLYKRLAILKTDENIYLKLKTSYGKTKFYYSYDNENYKQVVREFDTSHLSDEGAAPMGFTGAFFGMAVIDLQKKSKEGKFLSFEVKEWDDNEV